MLNIELQLEDICSNFSTNKNQNNFQTNFHYFKISITIDFMFCLKK